MVRLAKVLCRVASERAERSAGLGSCTNQGGGPIEPRVLQTLMSCQTVGL